MPTTVRIPIDIRTADFSIDPGNAFWKAISFTDWDPGFWEFAVDVDGRVYGVVGVPSNVAVSPNPAIVLATSFTQATTVDARWNVATEAVADGESLIGSGLTAETAQDITHLANQNRHDVRFPASGSLVTTVAANDLLIVEILHEGSHANDTASSPLRVYEAWLEIDVE